MSYLRCSQFNLHFLHILRRLVKFDKPVVDLVSQLLDPGELIAVNLAVGLEEGEIRLGRDLQ